MSKQYIGVAPFTMARTAAGGYVNILADDPVPDSLDKDDLKRLVDEGFLGEVKASEDGNAPDSSQAPAKSASKADWVAFATAEERGDDRLSEEDANAATKEQLADRYSA